MDAHGDGAGADGTARRAARAAAPAPTRNGRRRRHRERGAGQPCAGSPTANDATRRASCGEGAGQEDLDVEQRKAPARVARAKGFAELYASCARPRTPTDPRDIADRTSRRRTGRHKLKRGRADYAGCPRPAGLLRFVPVRATAALSLVPARGASSTVGMVEPRRQMMLLEENMHSIRMPFNGLPRAARPASGRWRDHRRMTRRRRA